MLVQNLYPDSGGSQFITGFQTAETTAEYIIVRLLATD